MQKLKLRCIYGILEQMRYSPAFKPVSVLVRTKHPSFYEAEQTTFKSEETMNMSKLFKIE